MYIFISDNNLSKCQWIFTKLGVCIGIVQIRFGIANHANGKISSIFYGYLPTTHLYFCFRTINFSKSGLGLQMGKLHQFLTKLSAHILFSVYVHVCGCCCFCVPSTICIFMSVRSTVQENNVKAWKSSILSQFVPRIPVILTHYSKASFLWEQFLSKLFLIFFGKL